MALSLKDLASLCRALRIQLGAGMTVLKVFRQQKERGNFAVRPLAERVADRLGRGDTLHKSLKDEAAIPLLMKKMVEIGEETGHLAEVAGELEEYFEGQVRMRRELLSKSLLPIIQFTLAIFVVAGLIWILGMIGSSRGQSPIRLFGLSGGSGALTFLGLVFGSIFAAWTTARILGPKLRNALGPKLWKFPIVGPCLESWTLGRLSWTLGLTLDTPMPIDRAVRLGFEAIGADDDGERVANSLNRGKKLAEGLMRCRWLPVDFLAQVEVAEIGGIAPEQLQRLAEHYRELTADRVKVAVKVISFGMWLIYAAIMVKMILGIAGVYLGGF